MAYLEVDDNDDNFPEQNDEINWENMFDSVMAEPSQYLEEIQALVRRKSTHISGRVLCFIDRHLHVEK
jgi:hypothetical protein